MCIALNSGASTSAITLISLIRMFSEGPAVSLNGSPTVSPTTAALCAGALAAQFAALDVFLGVIPCTAGIGHENRQQHAGDCHAGENAAQHVQADKAEHHRHQHGEQAGATMRLIAALAEMSTHLA